MSRSFRVKEEGLCHVCIGPMKSAIRAAELLNRGKLPTCWSRDAEARAMGTVLVHKMDNRLPVTPGQWTAANLTNLDVENVICGGMVWNSDVVGGEAEAAKLLWNMEDAGAVVICNHESDAVRAQGIRFIGRYSWESSMDSDSETDEKDRKLKVPLSVNEQRSLTLGDLVRGPMCVFSVPEGLLHHWQPLLGAKLQQVQSWADAEIQKRKGCGETETYDGQFLDEVLYGDRSLWQHLLLPPLSHDSQSGFIFSFDDQEYLFGRVWLDKSTHRCIAMCVYTYSSPEYFALMTVNETSVSPVLAKLLKEHEAALVSERQQLASLPSQSSEPTGDWFGKQTPVTMKKGWAGAFERLLLQYADRKGNDHCLDLELVASKQRILDVWNGLTIPMQEHFLSNHVRRNAKIAHVLCDSEISVFQMNATNFERLFVMHAWESSSIDEDALLCLLRATDQTVVQQVIDAETQRVREIDRLLCDHSYPSGAFSEETMRLNRASILACYVSKKPLLFAELLQRGFSINQQVSDSSGAGDNYWRLTMLSDAALAGDADSVRRLLQYGAEVDESIGGDGWNAVVYAVYGNDDRTIHCFREHCPDHSVWSRSDIPLYPLKLPACDAFGLNPAATSTEDASTSGPLLVGTLQEVRQARQEEMEAEEKKKKTSAFGGGFNLFKAAKAPRNS